MLCLMRDERGTEMAHADHNKCVKVMMTKLKTSRPSSRLLLYSPHCIRASAAKTTDRCVINSMKQCSDIPVELKLHVASYLSSNDLAALGRVDKEHIHIARDLLFQAPEIGQCDEGHRILCFLRTVFARSELLHQVRSLSISFVRCTVPLRPSSSTGDAKGPMYKTADKRIAELDSSQYRTTRNE